MDPRGARAPRWLVGLVVAAATAVVAASAALALVTVDHHTAAAGAPTAARTLGTDRSAPTGASTPTSAPSSTSSSPAPTTTSTSASASTASGALAAGQQGTTAQVPWSAVGTGWVLATWQPSPSSSRTAPGPTTLVLVDPAGGRYVLEHWHAPGQLADWSGDGVHALFVRYATADGPGPTTATVTVLDVRTGRTTSFQAPSTAGAGGIRFTEPDGTAVLVGGVPLRRYSLTGSLQLAYPATFPSSGNPGTAVPTSGGGRGYAESADGTRLALGATSGTDLVANTGKLLGFLPAPPGSASCQVVRWRQGSSVLTSCTNVLWSQPTSGGAPTQVAGDGGLAVLDAWWLPGGTLAQIGGCGSWLDSLGSQGTASPLQLPGFNAGDGHDTLVGVNGPAAAVVVLGHCTPTGPPHDSLLWYDPGSGSVTPVLGGTASPGSVDAAVAWGGTTRT